MGQSDEAIFDVIIIGAGPAGGTAAIYAARARLKTLVIDKARLGGSLAVAPKIANFPAVTEPLPGAELARIIKQQALGFGAEYLQAPVLAVELEGDRKQVFTAEGARQGKALIIATGAMGRGARVPGEEEFVGRGVSYCATCDAAFYDGQVVAVAGNGEEAADDALRLTKFASRVHLLSPTPQLLVSDDLKQALAAEPKIEMLADTKLAEIHGDGQVNEVVITPRGGPSRALAVDGVFIHLAGNKPVTDFLQGALELTDSGCIRVDHTMTTAIAGVFAAGDVRCSEFRQAITAAADGAIAAMSADRYVSRRESFRPSR
jgi:thioredoxin reductase (NADPH)